MRKWKARHDLAVPAWGAAVIALLVRLGRTAGAGVFIAELGLRQ